MYAGQRPSPQQLTTSSPLRSIRDTASAGCCSQKDASMHADDEHMDDDTVPAA